MRVYNEWDKGGRVGAKKKESSNLIGGRNNVTSLKAPPRFRRVSPAAAAAVGTGAAVLAMCERCARKRRI